MKTRQWLTLGALLILVVAAAIALVLTGRSGQAAPAGPANSASDQQSTLVDQRPLQSARKLAALVSTPEEQRISRDTLRLADHEVDLAFAEALRDAQEHPEKPTAEMRELSQRVDKTQSVVKADEARVHALNKSLAAAGEVEKDKIQQQLDLAQAQATMDQDQLDDAKEDLARAGGDRQSKIQRLLEEHEAADHATGAPQTAAIASETGFQSGNLAAEIRAWYALRQKQAQVLLAGQEAMAAVSMLTARHNALEQHVKQESAQRSALREQTAGMMGTGTEKGPSSKQDAAAALVSWRHFSDDQKGLSDLDKRIQDETELAGNYANWSALVAGRRRTALHEILQGVLWILFIILALYLVSRLLDRYFTGLSPEKRQLHSLRVVLRFALQAVGVLLILFVMFGAPTQTPTILGLAGAGLTVALKDFIVGFFGWFVLMGRNGIRVGDWVEINGVGGEVVEVGLLRTVLLETGNWTDSGHPTGRRVAFVNSYAVEGHFFNFSTSGQWLWDEIQILVPPGDNPYPVIDSIQKLVSAETEANARMAEQEWQKAASRYRVKSFSAVPSINVRPSSQGIEIVIRYITRAHERYEVRARLHQAIVDMLHRKHVQAAASTLPAPAENT
jgi:small-conductance mechanosensitive channel